MPFPQYTQPVSLEASSNMPATTTRRVDPQLEIYMELRARWRTNPIVYVQQRFGVEPTWQQAEILKALTPLGSKVSVRSGHGIGKSAAAAWAVSWVLETMDFAKVPCTAPSSHQLRDILWGELSKWRRKADALSAERGHPQKYWLTRLFKLVSDSLYDPGAKEWGAFARTARKEDPEALQGFHCFAQDTVDVLTDKGWIPLEQITMQDRVLCADEDTFETQWAQPCAVHSRPYYGMMYEYHGRFLDFCVTPNHQFVYQYRQCGKRAAGNIERWKWFLRPVAEMHKGKCRIPKTFMRPKPETASDVYSIRETHYRQPIFFAFSMKDWLEFLGWYLAEGYVNQERVIVCQTADEGKRQHILAVTERLGLNAQLQRLGIFIFHAWLVRHLRQIVPGHARTKRVPAFVFEQSTEDIWAFLHAFRAGDGTGERLYYTSSPGLADDLQRLILLTGSYSTINRLERIGTPVVGLPRQGTRQADYFKIREFCDRAKMFSSIRPEHLETVPYDGLVSCLTVPGGLFYVRDRKTSKPFWTHNSENLLYVIDEASGIDEAIYEAAEGALSTPGARVLLLGNPTRTSGTFYASHHKDRASYTALHFRSEDSPLVDASYRPRLVQKWGEGSNVVRVRADGEFPRQEDDVLISLELTEPCLTRERREGGGPRRLGVDVAWKGCFDDETEILTDQGWKYFADVHGGERVLTLHGDVAEWGPITQIHAYAFAGELNYYESSRINFAITDNHRLLVRKDRTTSGAYILRRFDELPATFTIRRCNTWSGHSPDYIEFRTDVSMPHGGTRSHHYKFSMLDWAAFLGWFVSEGCVYQEKRAAGRYIITLSQIRGPKRTQLEDLLTNMGIRWTPSGNNNIVFTSRTIGAYLMQACGKGAAQKRIPPCIKEGSIEVIHAFLDAFCLGDGTQRADGDGRCYVTTSQQLANDLQEILAKIGRAGRLSLRHPAGSQASIEGRIITRTTQGFVVYDRQAVSRRVPGSWRDSELQKARIERKPYKGMVYCVSTPYQTIYVRRHGCPMWSGNSDRTTLVLRHGSMVEHLKAYAKDDTMVTVGHIMQIIAPWHVEEIYVDTIGLGAGVHNRLDELRREGLLRCAVHAVNVATKAPPVLHPADARPHLLRDYLWLEVAHWLSTSQPVFCDVFAEMNEDLVGELSSVTFGPNSNGEIVIEDKEHMRKRLGHSPDLADALCCTFMPIRPKVHLMTFNM